MVWQDDGLQTPRALHVGNDKYGIPEVHSNLPTSVMYLTSLFFRGRDAAAHTLLQYCLLRSLCG